MRRSRTADEARHAPGSAAEGVRRVDVRARHTPLGVLAVAGAVVSLVSAVIAVRASRAGQRPRSGLDARVVDGRVRRDLAADARRYAFTVTLANRSSVPHAIAAAGLRVSYRTRANFLGAVDLPLTPSSDPDALHPPLRLLPGETVTRVAELETSNIIPRHCRVEGYALLLIDASGERHAVPASLPQVLRDDHDGDGPRTWGWD